MQNTLCITTMNLRKAIGNSDTGIVALPLFDTEKTIYEQFLKFHREYPIVYRLFEQFSLQLLSKGYKKIGSKMIMERIRWEYITQSMDEQGFKINNNYTCHYARLFMKNHPEYKDCFETRTIKRA